MTRIDSTQDVNLIVPTPGMIPSGADVDRINIPPETGFVPISRIAVDWDRGTDWRVYDGERDFHLTRQDFLDGKLFADYPGAHVYIEGAHLQERRGQSVAQIYNRGELEIIGERATEAGVRIYAFPAKLTPRARDEVGVEKADDVRAIHGFTFGHPEVGIMRWCLPDARREELWDHRNAIRQDMNFRLNFMRTCDYETEDHTHARAILQLNFTRLSPGIIEWFDIRGVQGKNGYRVDFHNPGVMAVYVAVFDADHRLRLNRDDRFIGRDGVLGLLQLHPYHFKSGTGRSNLMWHRLRNELKEKENGRQPEKRRDFSKAVRGLIKVFRDSSRIERTSPVKEDRVDSGERNAIRIDETPATSRIAITSDVIIIQPMPGSRDYIQPSLFREVDD